MTASNFPMAQFEDGMIALVKAASAATVGDPATPLLGYVLRQVDTYKGQLNGGPDRIVRVIADVPAVWACFEDAVYGQDDGLWTGTFSAVCLARNARNEKAARRGASAGEVGAYQIGKDIAGLLDGQAFGIRGVVAMRCTRIDAPFNMDFEKTRAAIVLLTFQAKWDPADMTGAAGDIGRFPPGEAEGDFLTFDVSWDVPPFTQPEPGLPIADGSSAIDARDTIHPQES